MHLNPVWRFVAFFLLLIYAALVAVIVLLLLKNLGIALILGATSLLLVYAVWLIFVGSDRSAKIGKWLAAIAGAALFAELLIFLSDQKNRRAVYAIVVLTLVYIFLFGLIRKQYWTKKRQQGEESGKTAEFKNPYLIINPKAGNGRATKANIADLAAEQGIHVIMTKKGVDIAESALEAVKAGADVLGISGGDGSIGAVAKVAIHHKLPMVVLPGGTRCHFARDLGLDPKQIVDALAGFTGVERRIDAAEINGRIFLNNASFGLYADIVDHPEYREHKVQVSRQVLQDIVAGKKQPYDLRFKNGDISYKRAVQVLVGVNRYNTMSLLELGHRERLDEGVVQVTTITKLNNQLVRQLVEAMSIKKLMRSKDMPGVDQWVDTSFTVLSKSKEIAVGVDGEREVHTTPVKIHILPGALRIYLPAEGERNRKKNPLSRAVVREVWESAKK